MARKKARKKVVPRHKPKARPVFGFWYPDNPEVDEEGKIVHTNVLLKDCNMKHIIEDECEEGYWGE